MFGGDDGGDERRSGRERFEVRWADGVRRERAAGDGCCGGGWCRAWGKAETNLVQSMASRVGTEMWTNMADLLSFMFVCRLLRGSHGQSLSSIGQVGAETSLTIDKNEDEL